MENNNGFTLKDVIFNLLFIILFVFILLWLFPSKFYLNEHGFGGGIYNSSETQTNQVFNHNITTMKEAAISYFTTSRLPKKAGDKVTMTLRQMRDEKLLLSLIDSKGNVCEEGISYIEMTKDKDEYILKVHLACSDNEDYILVHLGCYDYCDADICEKQDPIEEILYKYQYKLEKPCTLTNWSEWTNWSLNYVSANSNRKVETKVETQNINATTNKACPAGYLYSQSTGKCYKSSNSTDIKDAEKVVSYKCEEGYSFDEEDKKCKKQVSTTTTVAAKENEVTYNCNEYSGYTLSGNKCIKTITETTTDVKDATPVYSEHTSTYKESYSCKKEVCSTKLVPTLVGGVWKNIPQQSCKTVNSTCYRDAKYTEKYISSYNCNKYSGYTLNGTSCVKEIKNTYTDTKDAKANATTYYCENKEHTLEGKICKYEVTNIEIKEPEIIESYNCNNLENYVLNENKCEKIVTDTDVKDVIITFSCPSGYTLNNNKCVKNVVKYRYSERKCVGGSIDYKWSESDKDEELLKHGYKLTGKKEEIKSK